MKRWTGFSATIAAALILGGCNQPRTEENVGGGGGRVETPVAAPAIQLTRDNLGEAYVQAARAHASVVRGDHGGAVASIRAVRTELSEAKRTARLDTQARINELDLAAIKVQREIEQRSLNTYQSTENLVDQVQNLFATAMPRSGGGGGAMPAANENETPPNEAPLVAPENQEPMSPQMGESEGPTQRWP